MTSSEHVKSERGANAAVRGLSGSSQYSRNDTHHMLGQNALKGNFSMVMVEVTPNASAVKWGAAPRWPTKYSLSRLVCDLYSWA